jgi:hypothetical protein
MPNPPVDLTGNPAAPLRDSRQVTGTFGDLKCVAKQTVGPTKPGGDVEKMP